MEDRVDGTGAQYGFDGTNGDLEPRNEVVFKNELSLLNPENAYN